MANEKTCERMHRLAEAYQDSVTAWLLRSGDGEAETVARAAMGRAHHALALALERDLSDAAKEEREAEERGALMVIEAWHVEEGCDVPSDAPQEAARICATARGRAEYDRRADARMRFLERSRLAGPPATSILAAGPLEPMEDDVGVVMDSKVPIFLAGPKTELPRVESAAISFRAHGCEITEPWWLRVREARVRGWMIDMDVDPYFAAASALRNDLGVKNAKIVVALCRSGGGVSTGVAGEIGFANALGIHVVLVGNHQGFIRASLCHCVADIDDALAALRALTATP